MYRCSWAAHPFIDMSQVEFKENIVNPSINSNGKIRFEPVQQSLGKNLQDDSLDLDNNSGKLTKLSKTFPRDNRSLRDSDASHLQVLEQGQCAKLKYNNTIAKYDNAK